MIHKYSMCYIRDYKTQSMYSVLMIGPKNPSQSTRIQRNPEESKAIHKESIFHTEQTEIRRNPKGIQFDP